MAATRRLTHTQAPHPLPNEKMFTRQDARWLSETVGTLYAARSVDELTSSAMQALDPRFSLHSFACEEIGRQTAFYQLVWKKSKIKRLV